MKAWVRIGLATSLALLASAAYAAWKPIEKIENYAVSGTSGAEIYASIGKRGPKVGNSGRAIAFTNFKLTWSRNYVPKGNDCSIVSARPKLIITYTLPEPAQKLSGSTLEAWEVFIAGVREHEKVHGQIIEDMVRQIEAYSVGLTVTNDPGCSKIRKVLIERLTQLSLEQRQRSRDFDRDELGENGNIHRLVLMLVNDR